VRRQGGRIGDRVDDSVATGNREQRSALRRFELQLRFDADGPWKHDGDADVIQLSWRRGRCDVVDLQGERLRDRAGAERTSRPGAH
jgi:hypothetical protein